MSGETITRLIGLLGVLLLVAAALAARRPEWPQMLRYTLIWVAMTAVAAAGYTLFQGR